MRNIILWKIPWYLFLSFGTTCSFTLPKIINIHSSAQKYGKDNARYHLLNSALERRRQKHNTFADLDCIENKGTTKKQISASCRQLNRRERMELILEEHGYNCIWCQTPLDIDSATTDHVIPRIKGGPSWIENELASCRKCNKARGHLSVLNWTEECKMKGFEPNQAAIEDALFSLNNAIEERGGQRKARPHLARQLRLLTKKR